MKIIFNGVLYNTETAQLLGTYETCGDNRARYVCESLYRKNNGEFFIAGEGGPLTDYATYTGDNTFSGGATIYPIEENEARFWVERHLTAEEYIAIFGEVPE